MIIALVVMLEVLTELLICYLFLAIGNASVNKVAVIPCPHRAFIAMCVCIGRVGSR